MIAETWSIEQRQHPLNLSPNQFERRPEAGSCADKLGTHQFSFREMIRKSHNARIVARLSRKKKLLNTTTSSKLRLMSQCSHMMAETIRHEYCAAAFLEPKRAAGTGSQGLRRLRNAHASSHRALGSWYRGAGKYQCDFSTQSLLIAHTAIALLQQQYPHLR